MKTKFKVLKLLVILCGTFATTVAFGQVITWIGPEAALPGGANLGRSTNWSGNNGHIFPSPTAPVCGIICAFDGTVPGNLVVYSRDGIDGMGIPIGWCDFGGGGLNVDLTPGQTGSVNLICHTSVSQAPAMVLEAFRIQSGAGQFILGNNTSNQLAAVLRPSAGIHTWINNSANPVIINPNFQIQNGGGSAGHVINFQGTGDFAITNNLRWNNGAPAQTLQWDSTGTTIWAAGGVNNQFNSPLGNVVINAGKVIVESSDLLPVSPSTTTVSNGTLIVNGNNDTASPITVNGGTLGGTGVVGTVTIQSGGTLAPGTSVGTLTISSNLNIAGNMIFEVNKSLTQFNDFVVVAGTLTNTGTGTLTVSNLGPVVRVGDKFKLFSKHLQNGSALNVVGANALWINNLAVDGSISISSFVPAPTLNYTNTGSGLQFSWSGSFKLQSQTNDINVGISNNWSDYPGGGTSGVTVPIDATKETVFFRLAPTP